MISLGAIPAMSPINFVATVETLSEEEVKTYWLAFGHSGMEKVLKWRTCGVNQEVGDKEATNNGKTILKFSWVDTWKKDENRAR